MVDIRRRVRIVSCENASKFQVAEVFSPTTTMETIRLVIALACDFREPLVSYDVHGAYLWGKRPPGSPEVFLRRPKAIEKIGIPTKDANGKPLFWRVVSNHYGLRDAGLTWWRTYRAFLVDELGFSQSVIDVCLFYKRTASGDWGIIVVFVDDSLTLLTGAMRSWFEAALDKKFQQSHESAAESESRDTDFSRHLVTHFCSMTIRRNHDLSAAAISTEKLFDKLSKS